MASIALRHEETKKATLESENSRKTEQPKDTRGDKHRKVWLLLKVALGLVVLINIVVIVVAVVLISRCVAVDKNTIAGELYKVFGHKFRVRL